MSTRAEEHILLVDEILESEEAFLLLALLFQSPRSLGEMSGSTGLEPELVADLVAAMSELGLVRTTSARTPRFVLRWKPFTQLFVDAAVGMDTEISIMVEAFEDSGEDSFEEFASRAARRVERFEKELCSSPEFVSLLKDYLRLLCGELLVDDPKMYDTTLLDAAVAFESFLAKVGPGAFKKRSKKSPRLLAAIRAWARYASGVNMLGEVALAETMDAHGLVRT
jgi:hypothetical protein